MNDDQQAKAKALAKCTFQVGSPDKRFVRNINGYEGELTEKQAAYLDRLCYRYRVQLGGFVRDSVVWERWVSEGRAAMDAKQATA